LLASVTLVVVGSFVVVAAFVVGGAFVVVGAFVVAGLFVGGCVVGGLLAECAFGFARFVVVVVVGLLLELFTTWALAFFALLSELELRVVVVLGRVVDGLGLVVVGDRRGA
jgi:hypothetical protein